MREKSITGLRLLIITLGLLVFTVCPDRTRAAAATEEIEIMVEYDQDMARSILEMINEYRTSGAAWYWNQDNLTKTECGYLPALQYDYDLEKVAMKRAAEIAVFYDHMRPDGNGCWTTYSDCGYSWYTAGENIAAGYYTAKSIHTAWMEENDKYSGQGHRRNILDSGFGSVGIACVKSNGCYYWVEEFSGSCHNSVMTVVSTEPCTVAVLVETDGIEITGLAMDDYCHDIYEVYEDGPASTLFSGNYWNWDVDWREYVGMYSGETIDNPITGCLFQYTAYSSDWHSEAVLSEDMTLSVADTSIAKIVNGRIEAVHCGITELVAEVRGRTFTIPLLVGHQHVETVSPATEKVDGYKQTECVGCGTVKGKEVIARIGSVGLESTTRTYTGKYQKPKVVVEDRLGNVIDKSNYDVRYSNYKKVGTATVKVTFKGDYEGTKTLRFTINPKPVKISSVSTSDGVLIKWKKLASQCDGYEIEYANDRAFTLNEGIAKVAGRTKTSRKLLFSKRNGKRYVRIRSYKIVNGAKYYSSWSDTYEYDY